MQYIKKYKSRTKYWAIVYLSPSSNGVSCNVDKYHYAVHFNSTPEGGQWKNYRTVPPAKGLRQWDQLSPYLFTLGTYVLSSTMQSAQQQKLINGLIPCRNARNLTHLVYANDSLLFFRASTHNCSQVTELLQKLAVISGLKTNPSKSSIVFSPNTPWQIKKYLRIGLGVTVKQTIGKYLRAYIDKAQYHKVINQELIQKISNKLKDENLNVYHKLVD